MRLRGESGRTPADMFSAPRLPGLLLVANFLSSGGGSRSVMEDLAERLEGSAEGVICVSPYRAGWLRGLHMLSAAVLRRKEYEIAVVDLYSGRAFLWGATIASLLSLLRRPFILVLRGGALPDYAARFPARVTACLKRAAAVTAPSRFLLDRLTPYRPGIDLLPNPLDLDGYRFRERANPEPRLVWVRSLHEMYNPRLALRVVSSLAGEFADVSLAMIGPDKGDGSAQRVMHLARELDIVERIDLAGGVPKKEVPKRLDQGDIFLNTTNVDNTPVSVMEAMACGLCIVSTDVGGIPYILENEKDALLVPPDDAAAMTAAVRRLLTEPGLAARLSRNARRKAETFAWTAVLPQWKQLLQSVSTKPQSSASEKLMSGVSK